MASTLCIDTGCHVTQTMAAMHGQLFQPHQLSMATISWVVWLCINAQGTGHTAALCSVTITFTQMVYIWLVWVPWSASRPEGICRILIFKYLAIILSLIYSYRYILWRVSDAPRPMMEKRTNFMSSKISICCWNRTEIFYCKCQNYFKWDHQFIYLICFYNLFRQLDQ